MTSHEKGWPLDDALRVGRKEKRRDYCRWTQEKYIHHFGDQEDESFDRANDPLEETNIAREEEPEALDARHEELLVWLSAVNATHETR